MNKEDKNKKGFTLIELLIVIGIIAVLASAVVVAINPAKQFQQARDATRQKQISSIYDAIISRKVFNNAGIWNCNIPLPNDRYREIQGPGMTDIYSCIYPDYLSSAIVDPKEGVSISGKNITDGLVGYWSLDKGYGDTAYDLSGNENHGTLTNMEVSEDWVEGKHGKALDFDGMDDYVEVPDKINDGEFSISFWFKSNSSSWDGLLYSATKDPKYFYIHGDDSTLRWYFESGDDSDMQISVNKDFSNEEWHHVVATGEFNSSGPHKLFIDSIEEASDTTPVNQKGGLRTNHRIGDTTDSNYGSTYDNFNGKIDDVRIYDKKLSEEEVEDLYNYKYETKYAIWENPASKNIGLKSMAGELNNFSTGTSEGVLEFDGNDDYVDLPHPSISDTQTLFSIEGWIYPEDNGSQARFITPYSAGIDHFVYHNPDGSLGVQITEAADTNHRRYSTSSEDVPLEEWTHFTVIVDEENNVVQIYIDGKLIVDEVDSDPISEWGGSWRLGQRGNGTYYYKGRIKHIKVYNRALSNQEVKDLYQGQYIANGLGGFWPLNEMEGCEAADLSGNENHGTLQPNCPNNSPEWTTSN